MAERAVTEPIKRKRYATKKELAEALTKALRTHPECDSIRVHKIVPLAEPGAVANWDAEFEAEQADNALTADQRRVMLAAKLSVQKRLDLTESDGLS